MDTHNLSCRMQSGLVYGLLLITIIIHVIHPANCSAEDRSDEGGAPSQPMSIGVILPLSGDFATASGPLRRGIEAAAIRLGHRVIFEDDGGLEPTRAVSAAHKLLSYYHVDLVILSSFDLVPAVHPLLSRARIPGVVLWDSNNLLLHDYPWVFALGYSPEDAGDTLASFVTHTLSARKVAIIRADTRWSETIAQAFRYRAGLEAATIISDEVVGADYIEFRSYLVRLLEQQPDVVFAPLYSRGIVALIRQARELGYTGRIVTGEVLFDGELRALGSFAEGVYLTNAWLSRSQSQALGSTAMERNVPDLARFALGYDAISVAQTYQEYKRQGQDPLGALGQVELVGITGEICFRGRKISPRIQPIMQIAQGGFTLVRHRRN